MHPVVLVAIGGSMGAVARWGIGEVLATDSESGMPWATLLVNLLGSFALGMLLGSGWNGDRGTMGPAHRRWSTRLLHDDVHVQHGTRSDGRSGRRRPRIIASAC